MTLRPCRHHGNKKCRFPRQHLCLLQDAPRSISIWLIRTKQSTPYAQPVLLALFACSPDRSSWLHLEYIWGASHNSASVTAVGIPCHRNGRTSRQYEHSVNPRERETEKNRDMGCYEKMICESASMWVRETGWSVSWKQEGRDLLTSVFTTHLFSSKFSEA